MYIDQSIVKLIVPKLVTTLRDTLTGKSSRNFNSQTILTNASSDDIVLTIDNFTGTRGNTVTVPIAISDAEAVGSVQISLVYDTRILDIPDPDPDTIFNEGIRRAGISSDWLLDNSEGNQATVNPVANVNEDTGEVVIVLTNPGDLPAAESSGTILEIDFQINSTASLNSVANIDLQTASISVNEQELTFGESNFDDGSVTVVGRSDLNNIQLFRFRNTTFDTGTYLFVGAEERDAILANPDFNQTFELEGNGSPAFTASSENEDDLTPFFRLKSVDVPGTFLFVSTGEYDAIFAENSAQRDKWQAEGLDAQGIDIPEFYLFGVGSSQGVEFNRFQNLQNNTFLYAGPSESSGINKDPNLSSIFIDQGTAFESIP